MPLHITVLPESRVVLIAGAEFVSGTDLARACLDMGHHPDWRSGFDEVWDLSGASEIDITPDELDEIVEVTHRYGHLVGGNRVVFVSPRDIIAALARLFELRTADLGRTYHVARTRGEAADWLGLAPGTLGRARRLRPR